MGPKELQPLKDGDVVRARPLPGYSKWFKAQVSSQEAPRSYQVRTDNGRLYYRNRSYLYKVLEDFQAMPDGDIGESKVNAQTLLPTRKPTEETPQVPPEPSALQLPDVSEPDLQPTLPSVPAPVSTRSGRIVRRPTDLRDFTT